MEKLKTLVGMIGKLGYRDEPSREAIDYAKENGIVIVWGESDDLIEFRGAIYDEGDCYEGGTIYLNQEGLFGDDCDCNYAQRAKESCIKLSAIWCGKDTDWTWSYKIDVQHETFEIYDDDEKYCQGIVFYLKDCKKC